MKTINVPGFHFINDRRTKGGHLFNLIMDSGTLKIMPIFDFDLHLIHTPLFEHVIMSRDFEIATKKIKNKRYLQTAVVRRRWRLRAIHSNKLSQYRPETASIF